MSKYTDFSDSDFVDPYLDERFASIVSNTGFYYGASRSQVPPVVRIQENADQHNATNNTDMVWMQENATNEFDNLPSPTIPTPVEQRPTHQYETAQIFKIVSTENADKMIYNRELIRARLTKIASDKGLSQPTYDDLREVSDFPYHSTVKPMFPTGNDYLRVQPNVYPLFGSTVSYDFRSSGDFISDVVFNIKLGKCKYAPASLPSIPSPLGLPPSYKSGFFHKVKTICLPNRQSVQSLSRESMVIGNKVRKVLVVNRLHYKRYVDSRNNTIPEGTQIADRVAYCEFPGERIIKKTDFYIGTTLVDSYTSMSYAWVRKFHKNINKYDAYCRTVGQETTFTAVSANVDEGVRSEMQFRSGPQTPKVVQPELNMWVKSLNWFSRSQDQALPNNVGDLSFKLELSEVNQIIKREPACYLESVLYTDKWLIDEDIDAKFDSTDGVNLMMEYKLMPLDQPKCISSTRRVFHHDVFTHGELFSPVIKCADMYVNTIFCETQAFNIVPSKVSMIRVHKTFSVPITKQQDVIKLEGFNSPIEQFYIGFQPKANNRHHHEDWHMCTLRERQAFSNDASKSCLVFAQNKNAEWAYADSKGVIGNAQSSLSLATGSTFHYVSDINPIESAKLTAQGVQIYDSHDDTFNSYNTSLNKLTGVSSSNDLGAIFINFSMRPNGTQLNGVLNAENCSNLHFHYSLNTDAPATLLVEAQSLNILITENKKTHMRYT